MCMKRVHRANVPWDARVDSSARNEESLERVCGTNDDETVKSRRHSDSYRLESLRLIGSNEIFASCVGRLTNGLQDCAGTLGTIVRYRASSSRVFEKFSVPSIGVRKTIDNDHEFFFFFFHRFVIFNEPSNCDDNHDNNHDNHKNNHNDNYNAYYSANHNDMYNNEQRTKL